MVIMVLASSEQVCTAGAAAAAIHSSEWYQSLNTALAQFFC